MSYEVALIAAAVLTTLLLLILQTHAAIVFLSLCAGSVLIAYIGNDAQNAASVFSLGASNNSDYIVRIVILLVPVVLSALALRGTMQGPRLIMNLVPAIAVGLLSVLLVVPLLPPGLEESIQRARSWQELVRYQDMVVFIGAVSSLLILWLSHRSSKKEHGKRKKH